VKESFDMAHIDGAHDKNVAHADFINTWPLVKKGGLIIWDDTQDVELNGLCDGYVRDGYVSEENVYETEVYKHRVLRK
jgi:predicted O-methyltransferase YrrM